VRSFEEWKAAAIMALITEPKREPRGGFDFEEQLRVLTWRLEHLECSLDAVTMMLLDLAHFCSFWGVPLRKVMPTEEELEAWGLV